MVKKFKIIVAIIILLSVVGCSNNGKLIGTFVANENGDLVNDKFNIERDINGDILSIKNGESTETFDYRYNINGLIEHINMYIKDNKSETYMTVDVEYYDNDKIFLLSLADDKKLETKQYYLYDENNKLKHILQEVVDKGTGTYLAKRIIEFDYFEENNIKYVLERSYNAITGEFLSGRIYTEDSILQGSNSLEKLGIITENTYSYYYNKPDWGYQFANIFEFPISVLLYSNKILYSVGLDNVISEIIYDENGNYITAINSTTYSTIYKKTNGFTREYIANFGNYIQRKYDYTLKFGKAIKLEIYEKEIDEKEYNKLMNEYIDNNKDIKYTDFSYKLKDYVKTKVDNIDYYYNLYMDSIKTNGTDYNKYHKLNVSSSYQKEIDILDNGDIKVKEAIIIDGSYNGFMLTLDYKYFDDNKIYTADDIEITRVCESDKDNALENIDGCFLHVNNASKGDSLKYTSKSTSTGIELMLYNPSNRKKAFYVEYTLKNVIVGHRDINEFKLPIFSKKMNEDFEIVTIKVNLPKKSKILKAWGHGPSSGRVELDFDKRYVSFRIDDYKANTPVDIRMVFDKQIVNATKSSNSNELSYIVKEERNKLSN